MALSWVITALLFSLVLSHVESSSAHQALLHGSVSCLDCAENNQLHGIRVLVGCDGVKKMAMTVTDENGHFRTELPRDSSSKSSTNNCLAKLLGGPTQLCSTKKTLVSNVVKAHDKKSFTIATPLAFFTSCSTNTKVKTQSSPSDEMTKTSPLDFGSSKIIGVPTEWGLPPASDYIPVLPIIGIP
ncbi:uncharacterized protein LOC122649170 [Telopea speciosissima]|uniref:uncharacterized protein LOC122649170 n=1 Tax=Telopea speciosissima TaxID=54955 RepID=UPI001CC395BC|nr:uncharacterized protein LOC122649170 [Telopea speciosissima]